MTKPLTRKFCGIAFAKLEDGLWQSESGIVISKCPASKIERWIVAEHPDGRCYCGTGRNIQEALSNSGLRPEAKQVDGRRRKR
jgi:hypothetical protein